jgi:crotonobetainyl-CoA:carnitine CoA-transferase CaiB-like acyl-CoA transferase
MVVEVEHARAGTVKTLGPPVKLSRTPASVRRAAPLYGQHTAEVLAEYGYSSEEIDNLAAAGAVIVG